ncbi:MAG: histidine--tRNA ligase [Spirochaetia bacterium]|nr:histidine--tRNA ligase [Spirochaetia bacterium]
MIEPKILKGFRDSLPAEETEKKRLFSILERTFTSFGFVPIDTPVLEYTEVLLGKGGGETDKQVYRFTDNGKRDISMRFDLTVPFARFVSANLDKLTVPFKRFHIAKVWRGENTQKGRYREFYQCDFDIVGVDTAAADLEILTMIYTSLKNIGVENFKIHLSSRLVFNRFLETLGIKDKLVDILRLVDKLAKIGKDEVSRQLAEITGDENAAKILDYISMEDTFDRTLEKITSLAGGEAEDTARLHTLKAALDSNGISDCFVLDPSITRGLDYYTGLVYETFLDDAPEFGSVCSGGRYNDLASLYTKTKLPGVGASIGIDRLISALEAIGRKNSDVSLCDTIIFNIDESLLGYYTKIGFLLRENGISCDIYSETKKLNKQFGYAEKKNIPVGIICGSEEFQSGTITVKNLATRENFEKLTLEEGIEKIKSILKR